MEYLYCTYLTIYSGNKLPPFYIGYSQIEKVLKGYHGSVDSREYKDIWIAEQKEHPELFKTTIITRHYSRQEALDKEAKFQKRFNVICNSLYVNKCIFPHFDQSRPKKYSRERVAKMVATRRRNGSYKPSPAAIAKMGKHRIGKKHTSETINKMVLSQQFRRQREKLQ